MQDILYYQNIYELALFERRNINMHHVNSVSVTLHVLPAAVNSLQWLTRFRHYMNELLKEHMSNQKINIFKVHTTGRGSSNVMVLDCKTA